MPRGRNYYRYPRGNPRRYTKRSYIQKNSALGAVRKLAGQESHGVIDTISKYAGPIGTIASAVGGIMSLVNSEDKYIDTTTTSVINTSGTQIIQMVPIEQGSDYNQRNGNKVLYKCVQIQFTLRLPDTATRSCVCRLVLVMDKKPRDAAFPSYVNLYGSNDIMGLIDKNLSGERYVVLKDFRIALNPGQMREVTRKLYRKLTRIHVQWSDGNATEWTQNPLHLFYICDQFTVDEQPTLHCNTRVCYMDN